MKRIVLFFMLLAGWLGTASVYAQNVSAVSSDDEEEAVRYSTSLDSRGGKAWFARQYPLAVQGKPGLKDFVLAICNGYPTEWTKIVKYVVTTRKKYTDRKGLTTELAEFDVKHGWVAVYEMADPGGASFCLTYWNRVDANHHPQKIILVECLGSGNREADNLLMAFNYNEGSHQLVPAMDDWKTLSRLARFKDGGTINLPHEGKDITFYYGSQEGTIKLVNNKFQLGK